MTQIQQSTTVKEKTPPSKPDGSFNPSTTWTPCSGVSTVKDDLPDSFHSLSDHEDQTIVQTPDSTTPQSSSASFQRNMSSSGASKLYQEFQQAAQSVALNITKPTDRPVPKALSAISPCPRHCQVFDFSATSTKEINKLPFKCPPPLPPKRDSTSSLPPLPLKETRPNTHQRGVAKGHFDPSTQMFKKK